MTVDVGKDANRKELYAAGWNVNSQVTIKRNHYKEY